MMTFDRGESPMSDNVWAAPGETSGKKREKKVTKAMDPEDLVDKKIAEGDADVEGWLKEGRTNPEKVLRKLEPPAEKKRAA